MCLTITVIGVALKASVVHVTTKEPVIWIALKTSVGQTHITTKEHCKVSSTETSYEERRSSCTPSFFAMPPSSRLKSSLFMQDIDFHQSCSLIHTSFRTQALQLCVGQLCLKSSHAKSPHALKVYEGLSSRWYVRSPYDYAHRTSSLNAGPSFEVLRE